MAYREDRSQRQAPRRGSDSARLRTGSPSPIAGRRRTSPPTEPAEPVDDDEPRGSHTDGGLSVAELIAKWAASARNATAATPRRLLDTRSARPRLTRYDAYARLAGLSPCALRGRGIRARDVVAAAPTASRRRCCRRPPASKIELEAAELPSPSGIAAAMAAVAGRPLDAGADRCCWRWRRPAERGSGAHRRTTSSTSSARWTRVARHRRPQRAVRRRELPDRRDRLAARGQRRHRRRRHRRRRRRPVGHRHAGQHSREPQTRGRGVVSARPGDQPDPVRGMEPRDRQVRPALRRGDQEVRPPKWSTPRPS